MRHALRSRSRLWSRAVIAAGFMGLAPAAMAASPFPAEVSLAALDGSNGFVLKGIRVFDWSGYSVSGAGASIPPVRPRSG